MEETGETDTANTDDNNMADNVENIEIESADIENNIENNINGNKNNNNNNNGNTTSDENFYEAVDGESIKRKAVDEEVAALDTTEVRILHAFKYLR